MLLSLGVGEKGETKERHAEVFVLYSKSWLMWASLAERGERGTSAANEERRAFLPSFHRNPCPRLARPLIVTLLLVAIAFALHHLPVGTKNSEEKAWRGAEAATHDSDANYSRSLVRWLASSHVGGRDSLSRPLFSPGAKHAIAASATSTTWQTQALILGPESKRAEGEWER